MPSQNQFVAPKNSWNVGSSCGNVELNHHQRQGRQRHQHAQNKQVARKEPFQPRIDNVQYPLGIDPFEADCQDVGKLAQQLAPCGFVATPLELSALPRSVGDDQAASMQHADKMLQVLQGDPLRGVILFKSVLDVLVTRIPVQHLQDRKLFFLKTKVLEPHRLLNDPVGPALIPLARIARSGRMRKGSGRRALDTRLSASVAISGIQSESVTFVALPPI